MQKLFFFHSDYNKVESHQDNPYDDSRSINNSSDRELDKFTDSHGSKSESRPKENRTCLNLDDLGERLRKES